MSAPAALPDGGAFSLSPALLTLTGLAALMVHGRIAGQAMRRGRSEDLPQMLETSGRRRVATAPSPEQFTKSSQAGPGYALAPWAVRCHARPLTSPLCQVQQLLGITSAC